MMPPLLARSPAPFRLGTTSYIVPDEILPNARFLADKVQDIELILFEVDDGQNNIPGPDVIRELNAIANSDGLTYTVHLPLDLRLGADGDESHVSLMKAKKVIECTRPLDPWAYVLHLDGKELRTERTASQYTRWQEQCVRALEIVSGWTGSLERLAVENLEGYPPDFVQPVLERIGISRCFDVGHLWLDGHDPVPLLREYLPRTRVIHLHGLAERDHKSVAHMKPEQLDPVIEILLREKYAGVLTLEIFNEPDFTSSKSALVESLKRLCPDA